MPKIINAYCSGELIHTRTEHWPLRIRSWKIQHDGNVVEILPDDEDEFENAPGGTDE